MALKTVKQYYESLKDLHPTAYILGEKVENVHEHPLIKHMVAAVAKTYELENDAEGKKYLVAESDLTGGRNQNTVEMTENGCYLY